jgi:hypothetical protein
MGRARRAVDVDCGVSEGELRPNMLASFMIMRLSSIPSRITTTVTVTANIA